MPLTRLSLSLALLLVLLAPRPAQAWDAVGHRVIARIAWEQMTPRARAAAVALLSHAPDDSGILDLYDPATPDPAREWFVETSVWADLVRDRGHPARQAAYHRGPWHYINYFFEFGPAGEPVDRPELPPDTAHVVERLAELQRAVADVDRPAARRAVDLAWMLHLVGDVHQPLHTTALVTAAAPGGDQGGNLFVLAEGIRLHGYWDRLISGERPRRPGEAEGEYIGRLARELMQRHPPADFAGALQPGEYERWARAGFATAKRQVYRTPEGETPSAEYRRAAYATAAEAAALAGYRLAELLNRTLGGGA